MSKKDSRPKRGETSNIYCFITWGIRYREDMLYLENINRATQTCNCLNTYWKWIKNCFHSANKYFLKLYFMSQKRFYIHVILTYTRIWTNIEKQLDFHHISKYARPQKTIHRTLCSCYRCASFYVVLLLLKIRLRSCPCNNEASQPRYQLIDADAL